MFVFFNFKRHSVIIEFMRTPVRFHAHWPWRQIFKKKMNQRIGERQRENINCNVGQVTVTTIIRLGTTQ